MNWQITSPFDRIALIAVGGALGAVARYTLGVWITARFGSSELPIATIAINIGGSFCLGLLLGVIASSLSTSPVAETLRFAIGVGFLGAFTTFSAFENETWELLRLGSAFSALLNVAISVVGGLIAVAFGILCGRGL